MVMMKFKDYTRDDKMFRNIIIYQFRITNTRSFPTKYLARILALVGLDIVGCPINYFKL